MAVHLSVTPHASSIHLLLLSLISQIYYSYRLLARFPHYYRFHTYYYSLTSTAYVPLFSRKRLLATAYLIATMFTTTDL